MELSGQRPNLVTPPDVTAHQGTAGTILIDPDTIIIDDVPSGSLDTLLPDILFADGPSIGTVSIAALEAVTGGTIVLEANNSINWFNPAADGSLDLQPGVGLSMHSGGSILVNPGNLIRAGGADITLLAIGNIQTPKIEMNGSLGGRVFVTSTTGRITLGGDITATEVALSAAGLIFTADEVINAGAGGVKINAPQLLGASTLADEAQINSVGLLDLTITGPNDTQAAAAARVRGTLDNGFNLTTGPSTGDVFINGVNVNAGNTTPPPPHGEMTTETTHEFVEPVLDISAELLRSEALQSTSQQIINLGNLETDPNLDPGVVSYFNVRNRSLNSSEPIPLYTLLLVAPQVIEPEEGYWRRFIEQFVIWEDSGEEAAP